MEIPAKANLLGVAASRGDSGVDSSWSSASISPPRRCNVEASRTCGAAKVATSAADAAGRTVTPKRIQDIQTFRKTMNPRTVSNVSKDIAPKEKRFRAVQGET